MTGILRAALHGYAGGREWESAIPLTVVADLSFDWLTGAVDKAGKITSEIV